MAIIDLNREMKINLLNAINCGKLDMAIFANAEDDLTIEEIEAEIWRLSNNVSDEAEAELLKRLELCRREITALEFLEWYADFRKLDKDTFLRYCGF